MGRHKLILFLCLMAFSLSAMAQVGHPASVRNFSQLAGTATKAQQQAQTAYYDDTTPDFTNTMFANYFVSNASGAAFFGGTLGTVTTSNSIYTSGQAFVVLNSGTNRLCFFVSNGGTVACNTLTELAIDDFPSVQTIPAANCNNATAGAGWSIGSGGTASCRAGTNNLGGYISITDTSSTFATFQVVVPEDWDSATNPSIRFQIASTDATNAHTIIPSIQVACYKGDGSTTDDVAANAAHSLSTITLNGNANRFWSTSNVQMNSTDMTGCVAGALMQITVGRATDSATNARFYSATITWPRLVVIQAD